MLNIKNNFNYCKICFINDLKALKEYKINFYLGLLMNFVYSAMFLLFTVILYNNFNEFLEWQKEQYIFFILILGLNAVIFGSLWFASFLRYYVKTGTLNTILVKPLNPFFMYMGQTLSIPFFVNGMTVYLTGIVLFLIFADYNTNIYLILGTLLISLLSGIFFTSIHRLLDSLHFFTENKAWIFTPYNTFYTTFDRFPATMFKNSKLIFFSFFCANAYYGTFATEFFFGNLSWDYFWFLIRNLILLNLFSILGIWIIWKNGLKRYEAFGN